MRPANPRIGGTSFRMRLNETYSQNIFIPQAGKEKILNFSKVSGSGRPRDFRPWAFLAP
jgi:hypothetical protein